MEDFTASSFTEKKNPVRKVENKLMKQKGRLQFVIRLKLRSKLSQESTRVLEELRKNSEAIGIPFFKNSNTDSVHTSMRVEKDPYRLKNVAKTRYPIFILGQLLHCDFIQFFGFWSLLPSL